MAELLYTDLKIDLRPSEIEAFIAKRWDRIAPLAHQVHGVKDTTKVPVSISESAVEKVKRLASAYGREMANLATETYGNRYPTANPLKAYQELVDAIETLVNER